MFGDAALQTTAQDSADRNKEALSTVNGFYNQTAAVLQETLKALRPVHDESAVNRYITELTKEVQGHLHSLTWTNSDLKHWTTLLEDDVNRLRSRERQAQLESERKLASLQLELVDVKASNSDLRTETGIYKTC